MFIIGTKHIKKIYIPLFVFPCEHAEINGHKENTAKTWRQQEEEEKEKAQVFCIENKLDDWYHRNFHRIVYAEREIMILLDLKSIILLSKTRDPTYFSYSSFRGMRRSST
jgi:hypothetical protein